MNDVYLGLGSNLGDRNQLLNQAITLISNQDFIDLVALSEFYETEPVNAPGHPKYLNAAMRVSTILSPRELLGITQNIESQLGRTSKGNYDPRTVDIDILFYNQIVMSDEDLVIPHPFLHDREFVLTPLMDLNPDFRHPILEMSIEELRRDLLGH
jgi:2-amino-4-hydroxy-6-hydroxymethyldihydropteridine diphosphokinase